MFQRGLIRIKIISANQSDLCYPCSIFSEFHYKIRKNRSIVRKFGSIFGKNRSIVRKFGSIFGKNRSIVRNFDSTFRTNRSIVRNFEIIQHTAFMLNNLRRLTDIVL